MSAPHHAPQPLSYTAVLDDFARRKRRIRLAIIIVAGLVLGMVAMALYEFSGQSAC